MTAPHQNGHGDHPPSYYYGNSMNDEAQTPNAAASQAHALPTYSPSGSSTTLVPFPLQPSTEGDLPVTPEAAALAASPSLENGPGSAAGSNLPRLLSSTLVMQVERAESFGPRLDLSLLQYRASNPNTPAMSSEYIFNHHNGSLASVATAAADGDSKSASATGKSGQDWSSGVNSLSYNDSARRGSTTSTLVGQQQQQHASASASASAGKKGQAPMVLSFIPGSESQRTSAQSITNSLLQSSVEGALPADIVAGGTTWDWSVDLIRYVAGPSTSHQGAVSTAAATAGTLSGHFAASHLIRKRAGAHVYEIVERTSDGSLGRCRTAKYSKGMMFKDKMTLPGCPSMLPAAGASGSASGRRGSSPYASDHAGSQPGSPSINGAGGVGTMEWHWKGGIHSQFNLRQVAPNGQKRTMATLYFCEWGPDGI